MRAALPALLLAGLGIVLPGAAQAQAQELRDFCADRPGLGTPACTVDPGHVVVEIGGIDWTREQDGSTRTDTIVAGETLVRVGLTRTLEAQIGWDAFGSVRTRDRAAGAIDRQSGTGDMTLALRRNLLNPDGSGLSVAVMPYTTLPTGGAAIGAGDWGAGVIAPISYSLSDRVSLELTPELDAAVNESGSGRHLAYGSVAGVELTFTKALSGNGEIEALRDDDPQRAANQALASVSLAYQPSDNLQFDAGAVAGLNAESPAVALYLGIARRF